MARLNDVAARYGLAVIEDAAESLGSTADGIHTGRFGRAGVLSFNGNKTITTGGGGAIITDDDLLAHRMRHLTTTARAGDGRELVHDAVGYNYRLPNLNAALGCAQLETLDARLAAKAEIAARYRDALAGLAGLAGVQVVRGAEGRTPNHWLNAVIFDNGADRDTALGALRAGGIESRPFWHPLHRMPMYAHAPRADLAVTESLSARGLLLPSGAGLALAELARSRER